MARIGRALQRCDRSRQGVPIGRGSMSAGKGSLCARAFVHVCAAYRHGAALLGRRPSAVPDSESEESEEVQGLHLPPLIICPPPRCKQPKSVY
jgi:hypothetical protein